MNVQQSELQSSTEFPKQNEVISLKELWRMLWLNKIMVISITGIFIVASIIISLQLPDQYKSEVLLAPTTSNDQAGGGKLANLVSRFGGLASMAGINVGASGVDKTALALETLESRIFLINFIKNHDLLIPLMATKKWDPDTNKLIIDDDIYNTSKKQWVRDVKPPLTPKPSDLEAYKVLKERLNSSQDKKSGFVEVSFEFFSPQTAHDWLTWIIEDLNNTIRNDDISESKQSIDFLTKQIQTTTVTEMKQVFFDLIQEQSKTMMLANVRDEYVLKTVDPALTPEIKSKPKRVILVILGTIIGGVFSLLSMYLFGKKVGQK